ncbi:hypothetical protein AB0B31_35080 [Catellatospora citrea]|uniref:hypothetical protein n=1 Tax=Catellatospora citrea TaxID=53366 RepID=UPI0033C5D1AE
MIEPSSRQPAAPTVPSVDRPLWTLIGPGVAAMVAACQLAIVFGPAHSALHRDLDASAAWLAMTVVAQLVAAALGAVPGFLLGRRAPTSLVASGLLLMLVGAVVTALSATSAMVLGAGVVTGLGAGAVLGTAAGLSGQAGAHRAQARLGLGLAVLGGLVAGPVLGWLLSTMLGWRPAYLSMVVLILFALVATAVGGIVAATRGSR